MGGDGGKRKMGEWDGNLVMTVKHGGASVGNDGANCNRCPGFIIIPRNQRSVSANSKGCSSGRSSSKSSESIIFDCNKQNRIRWRTVFEAKNQRTRREGQDREKNMWEKPRRTEKGGVGMVLLIHHAATSPHGPARGLACDSFKASNCFDRNAS